jgi:membrane-associated phospholipid phosphatase
MIQLLLALLCAGSLDSADSLWTQTETGIAVGTAAAVAMLLPLDQPIDDWFASHRTDASRSWACGSKQLGNGYLMVPLAGGLWLAGADGRAPRLERASREALEAWSLTELVVSVGKYGVHRKRPSESSSSFGFGGPGVGAGALSFPSGHAGTVWGMLPAYALEYSDHPWVALLVYGAAVSTSLSRLHDGEHWASDVTASAGIGLIANLLVRDWNQRRDSRLTVVADLGDGAGIRLVWRL